VGEAQAAGRRAPQRKSPHQQVVDGKHESQKQTEASKLGHWVRNHRNAILSDMGHVRAVMDITTRWCACRPKLAKPQQCFGLTASLCRSVPCSLSRRNHAGTIHSERFGALSGSARLL